MGRPPGLACFRPSTMLRHPLTTAVTLTARCVASLLMRPENLLAAQHREQTAMIGLGPSDWRSVPVRLAAMHCRIAGLSQRGIPTIVANRSEFIVLSRCNRLRADGRVTPIGPFAAGRRVAAASAGPDRRRQQQ